MKKKIIVGLLLILLAVIAGVCVIRYFRNPERIIAEALSQNDPALCEKIIVIPGLTLDIFGFLFEQGDKTHGARVGCYLDIARKNKNTGACELINGVYAGRCYVGMVEEDVRTELSANCGDLIGEQERKQCAEQIYPSLKQKYSQICNDVSEAYRRDLCYLEAVRSLDDIESSITNWGLKDKTLCSYIEDPEYQSICESQ